MFCLFHSLPTVVLAHPRSMFQRTSPPRGPPTSGGALDSLGVRACPCLVPIARAPLVDSRTSPHCYAFPSFLMTNFQDLGQESDDDQQRKPASSSSSGKRKLGSVGSISTGPAVRGLHSVVSRALRTTINGPGSRIRSGPSASLILTQRCVC